MKKIISFFIFTLSFTAFSKNILIEIWDIGNGSSHYIIPTIKERSNELVTNGTILSITSYSLKHNFCAGAYKVCFVINEEKNIDMITEEISKITNKFSIVDICPESDDIWDKN